MKISYRFSMTRRKCVSLFFLLSFHLVHGLSSDPRLPPPQPSRMSSSRQLTEKLLGLDLGYNVLNSEKLRQSMGVNLDRISDRSDDGDYIYVDEDDGETLPAPQSLVRDEDFVMGGPSPTWMNHDSPRDKFWNVNGPFWFPFSAPPPRRQNAPKKKILVGDQGQCGTGKCEFVLLCMFTGGKLQGGCGGFLYACCERQGTLKSFQVAEKVGPDSSHSSSRPMQAQLL